MSANELRKFMGMLNEGSDMQLSEVSSPLAPSKRVQKAVAIAIKKGMIRPESSQQLIQDIYSDYEYGGLSTFTMQDVADIIDSGGYGSFDESKVAETPLLEAGPRYPEFQEAAKSMDKEDLLGLIFYAWAHKTVIDPKLIRNFSPKKS